MKPHIKMQFKPRYGFWHIWSPNNRHMTFYAYGESIQDAIDGFRKVNSMVLLEPAHFKTTPEASYQRMGPEPGRFISGFVFQCLNRPSMWPGWGETEKEAMHDFFNRNNPKYLWMLLRVASPNSVTPLPPYHA